MPGEETSSVQVPPARGSISLGRLHPHLTWGESQSLESGGLMPQNGERR